MVAINFNLTNFNNVASFMNIFNGFDNDFEITSDGVLRQKNAPPCPFCGTKMNQNGYNPHSVPFPFSIINLSPSQSYSIYSHQNPPISKFSSDYYSNL
jgi:hypothetical protein